MNNNTLDLRRHSREMRRRKWWIIASVTIFALLALWYWKHHMPEYSTHSVMLIEEEEDNGAGGGIAKAGGISQMMRTFSIGGFGASSVDNERIIAETHTVLLRTIKDLNLNCNVVGHDGINRKVLYGNHCPIKVSAQSEVFDTLRAGLKMNITFNGEKANITVKKGMFSTIATLNDVALPCEVRTSYGTFQVAPNDSCQPISGFNSKLTVSIAGNEPMVQYYRKKITIDLYDNKADAVEFTLDDPCPERGIDILNKLMENYNNVRKEHKDEISRKEIEFYDNRIASLAQDLENADSRMVEFKKNNSIIDIEAQAGAIIKQDAATQQEAVKLRAEMEINQMILNELNKSGFNVLPILGDEATAAAISQYNELVASKQDLEKSARGDNVALISINEKIAAAKSAILSSAQQHINATGIRLNQLNADMGHDEAHKSQIPSQEKEYLNLLRDKELKNQLFIFLMQRRESSMLQLTKNTSPSFVIDKAYCSVKPSITKPIIVTAIALLLGLVLPVLFFLFLMKRKDRVEDAFDLGAEWEEKAIDVATTKGDKTTLENKLRGARSRLFNMENASCIICHDLTSGGDEVLNQFQQLLGKAGKSVDVVNVADADKLYREENIVDGTRAGSTSGDYKLIKIAQLKSLDEISDIIGRDDNALLMLVKKGCLKRKDFKAFVGDNHKENSMVLIF